MCKTGICIVHIICRVSMLVLSFSLLFACRSAKVQLDEDTSVEEPEWWESDVEETDVRWVFFVRFEEDEKEEDEINLKMESSKTKRIKDDTGLW